MFHSRLSELRGISTFLEGFCGAAGIERQHCLRLNLVLEELFINTVRHGHGGDCDAPVWMTLDADEHGVHVIYEDIAPPFNPYAHLPESPPDTTLEMRKIGGLGVLLTKELAATRDYAYLFGRNRIRLALSRQAIPDGRQAIPDGRQAIPDGPRAIPDGPQAIPEPR